MPMPVDPSSRLVPKSPVASSSSSLLASVRHTDVRSSNAWKANAGLSRYAQPSGSRMIMTRENSRGCTSASLLRAASSRTAVSQLVLATGCWRPAGQARHPPVDYATGTLVAHWDAHDREVTAMAFSPDGRILISAGREGSLKYGTWLRPPRSWHPMVWAGRSRTARPGVRRPRRGQAK